ncbi:MAG: glutamate--tRNA ligase [Legionellales bacterium RIFCSPHIGHO2_12_FULL_42_9]|nr:MAG: glutamate--tRNA ligase [Legionellales bacterium RIFCSPHIGHO2_12_FULL_42_9]
MRVRTRFAPSPTGLLHVGSARTALFAWLYAKHHHGECILRIEDTDEERSTRESVEAILSSMAWLGLTCDEGPYYQTDRYVRYRQLAQQLLDEGLAYYCTCSKERLGALRERQLQAKEKPRYDGHCRALTGQPEASFVVRFKNPTEGVVSFIDEVYGEIHVDNHELDDLILIRSDGNPTYNFAVVVDDWDMNITHVIRGDDHLSNTPRQINLYQALHAPIPVFAHLPMILGEDGKRLSKRHGAVGVMQFRALGILPHALLNYLVRLGWSYGDQEIFSIQEMIAAFDLKQIHRGVASFNYDKLYWLNQHYQKQDDPACVAEALAWHFTTEGIDVSSGPALVDLVVAQVDRCKTLSEMCAMSCYFYQDKIDYDENALKKHLRPVILAPMEALFLRLNQLTAWDESSLQAAIDAVCAAFSMNMGKIAQPLRVMITGSSSSPAIDTTLFLIGKPRVLSRVQWGLDYIRARAAL